MTLATSGPRQRSPAQVVKGFSMGKRWLLSGMRCGGLSPLNSPDNKGFRHFEQAWLSEAMDVVDGSRGNVK
jgi:hypothetical protein